MVQFYSFIKRISLLIIIFSPSFIMAQAPTIGYSVEIGGLTAPINIANAGDGSNRLFIAQQDGVIRVRDGPHFQYLPILAVHSVAQIISLLMVVSRDCLDLLFILNMTA
ncbi:MAG: hypothetical protein QM737_23125 [Ferruginibacter sp.]